MAKARWLSSSTQRKSQVLKITRLKMAFLLTKTLWKLDKVKIFMQSDSNQMACSFQKGTICASP